MCGGIGRGPGGIPLNENTLESLSKEERDFWNEFLPLAQKEIDENTGKRPYQPSKKLQDMYNLALEKYDAKKYCQIQQLLNIFNF